MKAKMHYYIYFSLTTINILFAEGSGYHFTKALTQKINLHTHFKLEYNLRP